MNKDFIEICIEEDYKTYLNINRLYSYQDINLYMLIGGRGIGKTTSLLIKAIKNYNKNGEQFIYIRRYKSETKKLTKLMLKINPNIKVKKLSDGLLEYTFKNKTIGYAIPLSVQAQIKSAYNFDNVSLIIMDEFILLQGSTLRYLENEVVNFFELVSTIVRTRKNYKVFLLGNNLNIFNPYCAFLNIEFDENNKFINKDRQIYAEISPINPKLLEKEKETPLYNFTKGTAYHDYHYGNKVLVNKNNYNILPKPKNVSLWFRLIINDKTLSFYLDNKLRFYVERKNKKIYDTWTYEVLIDNKINYYECSRLKPTNNYKLLTEHYCNGLLTFDNYESVALLEQFMNKALPVK